MSKVILKDRKFFIKWNNGIMRIQRWGLCQRNRYQYFLTSIKRYCVDSQLKKQRGICWRKYL